MNLSKTSTVPIQLEPAGATTIVTVNSTSRAVVDTTSNTSGTSVSTEQFSNFVTQRTVQSIYTIAPSVTRSGLPDLKRAGLVLGTRAPSPAMRAKRETAVVLRKLELERAAHAVRARRAPSISLIGDLRCLV